MIDSKTYYMAMFKRANELYPNNIIARNTFCILASGKILQMQERAAIKAMMRMHESYDEYRERVEQALSEDKET